MSKRNTLVKWLVVITYLAMVLVNALANLLPLNGVTTGQVSEMYPNLFAPAPITFSIWGVIYLLLACFTVYQIFSRSNASLLNKVGLYFSLSSLLNLLWVFAWHYDAILLSMVLMVLLLLCLIMINSIIGREELSTKEKFFIKLPFSIYFGWITVATIANATTLLVSWKWRGFGLEESTWAILIILVGMLIGLITTIRKKDIAYGLVIVWAYIGILIKHMSPKWFAGQYIGVIYTVIACIVLLLVGIIYIIFNKKNRE